MGPKTPENCLVVNGHPNTPGGRICGGVVLWAVAVTSGGWAQLLAIPGTMMLMTGVMNYCPAGLMTEKPANRSEFMASLKPTNLLN